MIADHSQRLLDAVSPLAHLRVIELACGGGELSDVLADAVGPHGNLLAGDLAEEAVHNTSARLEGGGNAMVARFDARQIPCADASADLVVAGMLLMLLEQPVNAPDEIRRVLRRGGRLGASVWATAKDNPWLRLSGRHSHDWTGVRPLLLVCAQAVRSRLGAPIRCNT